MIDAIAYILENILVAWPSILLGAAIPVLALVLLLVGKKRKLVPFQTIFYGAGTFLLVLIGVGVLTLLLGNAFMPSISVSNVDAADKYIYIGGGVILLAFFAGSELIRMYTFKSFVSSEKNYGVGITFASGFVLVQNFLILGLIYSAKIDYAQSVAFGILMLISGVVYLLNASVGYQLCLSGQHWIGFAAAISYYLMFAVMLMFSNVFVTYGYLAAVLAFNVVIGYKLLPLPFKKKGAE
jgi:hypothetical protein